MPAALPTASWCGCKRHDGVLSGAPRCLYCPGRITESTQISRMSSTTDNAGHGIGPAKGLGAVLDYACASHRRAALVLIVLAMLSFLPGFFQIPPVDRDEARFAQATKQMVESGNYVDIRFQNEVRYKKPVGIYWLQAAVVKTADALRMPDADTTIWLYRIPSLLGATGAVLL